MKSGAGIALLILASPISWGVAWAQEPGFTRSEASIEEISRGVRKELSGLVYYGVFDLLTYQVNDKGFVVLGGYVYHASLKDDAKRAVEKVDGVKEVENKIEILPASVSDDNVRWAVYRAIYFDAALARYGTAESQLAATRPRFAGWGTSFRGWNVFGEPRWTGRPFYGMEPVGDFAIHIIIKNSDVTLVGVVDSAGDRSIAGIKAQGVFGVGKVTNDLQVAKTEDRK
jgi:hyperosmotically inducible protein